MMAAHHVLDPAEKMDWVEKAKPSPSCQPYQLGDRHNALSDILVESHPLRNRL